MIRKILISTTLGVLTIGALAVVLGTSLYPQTVEASAALAAHQFTDRTSGHGAGHCGRFGGEHIELGAAVANEYLDLDADQRQMVDQIASRLQIWHTEWAHICEADNLHSVKGALDAAEVTLQLTSQALADIKPVLISLHQGLSADQQQKLHNLMRHHHQRRGHH